jgi:hypothetical protein
MKAEVYRGDDLKVLPSAAAVKQRRYRLRREFETSGKAPLYTHCRECGAPIKHSYRRGFCLGGSCKRAFFRKVQVTQVVKIKRPVQPDEISLWQGTLATDLLAELKSYGPH